MGRNTEAQATGRVLSAITRCKRHIPIVLIAAIVAAVFSRTLFLGQVLYRGDIEAATMPWFAFLSHERQAGQWLPWCTGVGCGFPLWANMQTGAFYLPNLLGILRIAPAWTLAFLFALHYFWAALGMYVLGRRFRLGTLGSFSAGIVYALTGFMVAHQIHYSLICAASWLPWFAVGTMLWALRRSVAGLVLASISLASAWLNHPQSPVFIVAFGLACTSVAVLVMRQREGSVCRQVLPSLAVAMLPVAVGTLLGGVVLWPAYELVRAGCGEARSGYEFMTSFSLPPRQLVTFLLPDFWGGPWDYSGAWNHWETCGYAGGICLLVRLCPKLSG